MAWKPKEKQLTPEEAVEEARRELAPFWLNSEPILAGVRSPEGKATVHPLDKSLERKAWLVLMADLTTYAGEVLLTYAREWARRFSAHELGFTLVVHPYGRCLENAKSLEPFLKRSHLNFPIVLDHDGSLLAAFGAKAGLPRLVLLHQNKVMIEQTGFKGMQSTEVELQKFLRLSDPGLPFSPPFEPTIHLPTDSSRMELNQATIKTSGVQLKGKWNIEVDRVSTSDAAATLSFLSSGAHVSMIAQRLAKTEDPSRMRVEVGGQPAFDAIMGPDLVSTDDGSTEIRVGQPQFYHVLAKLPMTTRGVNLKFPDADRMPVALYGLRFGN
jgi:hypothetical protein